jgi:hypothetical protein
MTTEPERFAKVRYAFTVAALYLLTVGFCWYALKPIDPLDRSRTVAFSNSSQTPYHPKAAGPNVIAGRPVRLVIPASAIDVPLDEGYYDTSTGTWTLSGYYAEFAMVSALANNVGGETFIYGHNNDFVFGSLRHNTPPIGAEALLYTDNGHIFAYSFESVTSLSPNDTSVLEYSGPPILLIQTCTGSLNEWRTEYTFQFNRVVQ